MHQAAPVSEKDQEAKQAIIEEKELDDTFKEGEGEAKTGNETEAMLKLKKYLLKRGNEKKH